MGKKHNVARFNAKGHGRTKGALGKKTLEVREKMLANGCDPILGMIKMAKDMKNSPEVRARMYAELAQYFAPKLKSIEHTGANGGPIAVEVQDTRPPIETFLEEFSGAEVVVPNVTH
jgi:hypothetical protein